MQEPKFLQHDLGVPTFHSQRLHVFGARPLKNIDRKTGPSKGEHENQSQRAINRLKVKGQLTPKVNLLQIQLTLVLYNVCTNFTTDYFITI